MSFPLTPVTGTGNPNPLVSVDQYRRVTKDTGSAVEDITQEITNAVYDIQLKTRRMLEYGQYNEADYLYDMGMVWPSASPIDLSQNVVSGNTGEVIYNAATDQSASSLVQGSGVWVGFFTPLPWMPVWTGVIPPQTLIKYYGGFQPFEATGSLVTGQTPSLPPKLGRAIITVAYYSLHPSIVTTMGAQSVSMGGVSISGNLSSFMQYDRHLCHVIRAYTHPQAWAWQN